ncbi:MAG: type II toxin-antitoxin system Phd/YefM family antitoxin [Anaerolineae bacterium]|nr:type II toxin-antitoxin system Phd/YefM family antitoxin [Anaerolineae bacterium]
MSKGSKPTPTVISSTNLQRNFGDMIRRAGRDGEHFIVERDGFPAIAIISATEYEMLIQDFKRVNLSKARSTQHTKRKA